MALYITAADLQALQDPETYVRLFDRNNDGIADADFVAKCIAIADSKVKMRCNSAFGGTDFDVEGGTVDEAIKAMTCAYAFVEAVMYSPIYTADEKNAFSGAKKAADEFFNALVKDFNNRPKTAGTRRAQPYARVTNTETTDGTPTNPFTRAADRRDPSAF